MICVVNSITPNLTSMKLRCMEQVSMTSNNQNNHELQQGIQI